MTSRHAYAVGRGARSRPLSISIGRPHRLRQSQTLITLGIAAGSRLDPSALECSFLATRPPARFHQVLPTARSRDHRMKYVLRHIGFFLIWNLVAGTFLLFTRPLVALPIALGLSGLLLWGYLLRPIGGRQPQRRWAALRLRPLAGLTLFWSIAAVPVVLILSWSLGDVYTRLVPVPAESLNPFGPLLATWDGRLILTIFAVAIAPLIEEFVFRGLLQSHFERRHGATMGILLAAWLFAIIHLLPWVFPLHFLLGIMFGYAVWASRSIWTGVLLHAANNSAAMLGLVFAAPEPAPTGTLWQIGLTSDLWTSLIALILSGIAAIYVAGKLRAAGRARGLRTG